jgi:hypothetical protein
VQKTVLVLSKVPLFSYLLTKLNITTHVYFNQKNFKDIEILREFYKSANGFSKNSISYSDFISNIKINEITKFLGSNLLSLIKLLLLEKKVIAFSETASLVSEFMVGIISLLPGNILFNYTEGREIHYFLESINRLGLPLKIFNNKTLLLLSASILDLKKLEKAEGYFVGTTNSFLPQNASLKPDLVINIDEKSITFNDKKLKNLVSNHSQFEFDTLKLVFYVFNL